MGCFVLISVIVYHFKADENTKKLTTPIGEVVIFYLLLYFKKKRDLL